MRVGSCSGMAASIGRWAEGLQQSGRAGRICPLSLRGKANFYFPRYVKRHFGPHSLPANWVVGNAVGGVIMIPDLKECRVNAQRCIEMANHSLDAETQSMLFEMAKSWNDLAEEMERIEAEGSKVKPRK